MILDAFEGIPGIKLNKAAFLMGKMVEKELIGRCELTFPQFLMLVTVNFKSHCKQTEMADIGHLTEAAVSRMVENMVEKGLLSRKENPENRREHVVELTEKGKSGLKLGMKVVEQSLGKVFNKLSVSEQQELDRLLDKILLFVYTDSEEIYA